MVIALPENGYKADTRIHAVEKCAGFNLSFDKRVQ